MSVKLLTEHRLEFVSLKGGCTGSSESTLVKMPHCWKSYVAAQLFMLYIGFEPMHVPYPGYINISKKRTNSDKFHKYSFSCMQCAVSCSSSLKVLFFFMQTETQLGNHVLCAKSAFVRQSHAPRATRVLKQQQQVVC